MQPLVRIRLLLWAGLLWSGGGACGEASGAAAGSPPALRPADVSGLPAGNATGEARTGNYAIVSSDGPTPVVDTCVCRIGTCAELSYDAWWIIGVSERDGTLAMSRTRGDGRALPCGGGIDADGTFWCGADKDGSLFLLKGQIGMVDGVPTTLSLDETQVIRMTDVAGERFDCDLRQPAIVFSALR